MSKSHIKITSHPKIKKSLFMKSIREYITPDHIKVTNSDFDFKKHHSMFKFSILECTSDNSNKIIDRYFNRNRYMTNSTNDFKRTAANYLVLKVHNTPKKVLLNYPPFQHYERVAKEKPNYKYFCSILVSNHLATSIATKRAAWINIFFYNFHKIGDFSKELLAKATLAENTKDRFDALLGIACHQRGTEPYFPSTSFVSGKQYDYASIKDLSEVTRDNNQDKGTGNNKYKDTKVNTKSKSKETSKTKANFTKSDTKLYLCTDDCIGATEEEYKLFENILNTFHKATEKTIRSILEKFDECSNMNLHDIYLLPREKKKSPKDLL